MAPKIKLSYFNIRGRAEPIRLALLLGNIDFEDYRLDKGEWADMKSETPYGSLPTMEVDGTVIAQSQAMLRYAGKLSKSYPEDGVKAMFVDEVLGTAEDLSSAIFSYRGSDQELVKAARTKFVEESIPRYWKPLDERVGKFNGDGPFILGSEVSIADLVIACQINSIKQGIIDYIPTDCLDDTEHIMKAYKAVMEMPEIVAWYKKYPIPNVTDIKN